MLVASDASMAVSPKYKREKEKNNFQLTYYFYLFYFIVTEGEEL